MCVARSKEPDLQPLSEKSNERTEPADHAGAAQLPELLTVNDFLQFFRISRTSFYREVNSGRLKVVKFGTATRICRTDAEAWMGNLPSVSVVSNAPDAATSRIEPKSVPNRNPRNHHD